MMYTNEVKYPYLHIVQHPLVKYKLSILRDKNTTNLVFANTLHRLTLFLAYEATRFIHLGEKVVETPIARAMGYDIPEIVLVPILRSGLGMAQAMQEVIPEASQGHVGMYRDSVTKKPVNYLYKMPEVHDQLFFVLDPMLATGSTVISAINKLLAHGVKSTQITFVGIVLAPEGVDAFYREYPTIPIFAAVLDEKLNDDKYIVPGLGDCGDRLFGTK